MLTFVHKDAGSYDLGEMTLEAVSLLQLWGGPPRASSQLNSTLLSKYGCLYHEMDVTESMALIRFLPWSYNVLSVLFTVCVY